MMNTKLQFLSDTFQFETDATVTGSGEDDDGSYVVANRTVFFPGGGGQEPDKGLIINKDGLSFSILDAHFSEDKLKHYVEDGFPESSEVKIVIDRDYRLQNARLHTAGHLLASVVHEKLRWPLKPVKGFHYQKGAYVEFEPLDEMEEIPEKILQHAIMEDISYQLPVSAEVASPDSLQDLTVFVPEDDALPEEDSVRLVAVGDYSPIPCGGTHL